MHNKVFMSLMMLASLLSHFCELWGVCNLRTYVPHSALFPLMTTLLLLQPFFRCHFARQKKIFFNYFSVNEGCVDNNKS